MSPASPLVKASRQLCDAVDSLSFSKPVEYVYNPLSYARAPHEAYLKRFGNGPKRVLLVGMNPGPFGMAQTGVPFGDVGLVRDFLGISGRVGQPPKVHPKRPIDGFDCQRSEVSGSRVWGWVQQRFGSADQFFKEYFVANYCPLVFMEESGRNYTPDKLAKAEREALFSVCDRALVKTHEALAPEWIVGFGAFAKARAQAVFKGLHDPEKIGSVLHPSPASPKANRGWAPAAEADLLSLGIKLPAD